MFKKLMNGHEDGIYSIYYDTTKIDNQIVGIFYNIYERFVGNKNKIYHNYNIGMAIDKNRKQLIKWYRNGNKFLVNNNNGKIGVSGLFWCKNKLLEIEYRIKKYDKKCDKALITVHGSNEKRKSVYMKYLKKLGYHENSYSKDMIKYII